MSISSGWCNRVLNESRPTKPGVACSTQAGRTTHNARSYRPTPARRRLISSLVRRALRGELTLAQVDAALAVRR